MPIEKYNDIFKTALQSFIREYENEIYTPLTESDVQFYLMALCKELMQEMNLPLDIHANCALQNYEAFKRKKIDMVIGSAIAVEIKFEANYPGVSKPVVFPKEAAKDIDRLTALKQSGLSYCHFIFLDEDGTHSRNFSKYTSVPIDWYTLHRSSPSYLLHICF